jgi:hypothetical protein
MKPELKKVIPIVVSTDSTVYHGPVAFDPKSRSINFALVVKNTSIYLPPDIQMKWFGKQLGQALMEIRSIVSFNNTWTTDLTSSAIPLPNIGMMQPIHIASVANMAMTDNVLTAFSAKANIDALTFVSDKENAVVPDLSILPSSYHQRAKKQAFGLWSSEGDQFIPTLSIQWKNGNYLKLNNIEAKSKTGINAANLYDASFSMTINPIQMHLNTLPALTEFGFLMSFNNLNPKGIADYSQHPRTHQAGQEALDDFVKNILTLSSQINLALNLNTELGVFTVQSNTAVLPGITADEKNLSMETHLRVAMSLLTQVLKTTFTVFDQAMLAAAANATPPPASTAGAPATPATPPTLPQPEDQAKAMIDAWISKGYLVKEGDDLVSSITYSQGVLNVNGKPMTPPSIPTSTPPSSDKEPVHG